MIELIPKYNEYNNCIENQIYTIVYALGYTYELAYIDSLYFHFDKEFYDSRCWTNLGNLIVESYDSYILNLTKLTGIDFNIINCTKETLYLEIDNALAENTPIIVFIDGYWCPWEGVYKKYKNFSHGFIIKGKTDDGYICTDGHRGIKDCYINNKDLYDGFLEKIVKIRPVSTTLRQQSWKAFIQEAGMHEKTTSDNLSVHQIRYFKDAVFKDLNMKKELEGFEADFITVKRAPIMLGIQRIKCERKKYEWCLRTLRDSNDLSHNIGINRLIDMASCSAEKWKMISTLFIKYYYSSEEKHKDKIIYLLEEVAALEESIVDLMINIGDN